MSARSDRARSRLAALGGYVGAPSRDEWDALCRFSKVELMEIALRLGARADGHADTPRAGLTAVVDEAVALDRAGIVPVRGTRARTLGRLAQDLGEEAWERDEGNSRR